MVANMSFNAVREIEIIAKFQKLRDCDISTKNNNIYPKFLITSIRNKNSYALLFSCPVECKCFVPQDIMFKINYLSSSMLWLFSGYVTITVTEIVHNTKPLQNCKGFIF